MAGLLPRYGRSNEEPERSHSVELDALSETGIVGFLLLIGAGSLGLASVARRRGAPLLPAALFASGVYLAVHASIDWVWSIPSVGLAGLVLVGVGASRGTRPLRATRIALVAAGAVAGVAVLGFAPPWLSARFTDRAYGKSPSARSQPRRGRRSSTRSRSTRCSHRRRSPRRRTTSAAPGRGRDAAG